MDNILKGIVAFQKHDFDKHKELFETLGRTHNPHTLFIGCSDSRVVPNLITRTLPGELFMVRNIANLVPLYREADEFLATTSAIEYAVQALNVENIIICGHSNCGGCASLYLSDQELSTIPHTRKWLQLALPVKEKVLALPESEDPAVREWLTEQINVVEQMKHLLSYPFIREKYQQGTLKIMGWHYIIETGEIFAYNKATGTFDIIESPMSE